MFDSSCYSVRLYCLFLLLLFLPAAKLLSQRQEPIPVIDVGFVTRTTSLADFDVNGFHVIVSGKTKLWLDGANHEKNTTHVDPYLGQSVSIYGDLKRKKHAVIAEDVIFHAVDKTPLSGFAIVERVLSPATPGSGPIRLLVRADGYVILINSATKTSFQPPLVSVADVKTNIWIKYHGKPQSDGIFLTETADFFLNAVTDEEAKLLEKNDYDPQAVDPDAKQNIAKWLILGIDPKKIPPYQDAAMQARIDRIGSSLIPAYQRSLPTSDLSRIRFRFQLIDATNWKDAFASPSGIILVPFQIVTYLQNDSQLATVLADNIACVLEKQTYRAQPGLKKMTIAEIASGLGGLSTFGAATIATTSVATADKRNAEDQSGRVSLGLLHDAGYDINQAPIAWWLLATDTAEKLPSTPLPPRAANLYKSLGSTWRNYTEASTQSSTALQTK
jgi:hypothetical protein